MARIRLTDAKVRTLRTDRPDEDHWHTTWHLPGQFGLRVSSSGRKTWVYISPQRKRQTLGLWPDLSLDEALATAERIARRHAPGAATLADLAERLAVRLQGVSARTQAVRLGCVRRHVLPALGEATRVHDTTTPMLQRLVDDAEAAGHHGLAANLMSSMRVLFEDVVRVGWHDFNPARELSLSRRRRDRRVAPDVNILVRVWSAADEVYADALDSGYVGMARQCLALQAQIACLQRSEHVLTMYRPHLADGWWSHPGAFETEGQKWNTKGSRPIAIALEPLLAGVIDRALQLASPRAQWVFSQQQLRRPRRKYGDDALRLVRQVAGLEVSEWRPHDARKHGATALDRLGIPLDHVQRLLGHTRPRSTATRYYVASRIAEGDPVVREVQRAWEAHLAPRLSAAGVAVASS